MFSVAQRTPFVLHIRNNTNSVQNLCCQRSPTANSRYILLLSKCLVSHNEPRLCCIYATTQTQCKTCVVKEARQQTHGTSCYLANVWCRTTNPVGDIYHFFVTLLTILHNLHIYYSFILRFGTVFCVLFTNLHTFV